MILFGVVLMAVGGMLTSPGAVIMGFIVFCLGVLRT